ncbi:hypothetical protein PENVUL_c016G07986 [Penicillium vulpinum]|uniref:Uncharacterized protein n=1 Tax=Penicillium vulpinum TaxID=29845 RepID=A0A1V6RYB0_9EURO|nr:hypothetical protein PENVUL_c016G07986 [Penicillium vulpinum]
MSLSSLLHLLRLSPSRVSAYPLASCVYYSPDLQ